MTVGISRMIKSTDASAPQLTNVAGSLVAVLDAALVNGFGSTAPLGWTKEFAATSKAVYRMGAGTRTFLRVDDSVTSILSGSYTMFVAKINAYETMVDIDNGVGRIPDSDINGLAYITKGCITAGNFPWWIIGDEAGFYLNIFLYSTNLASGRAAVISYYFGDYVPLDIKNKWNFIFIPSYYAYTAHPVGIIAGGTVLNSLRYIQRSSTLKRGAALVGIKSFENNTYFGQNILLNENIQTYATQKVNGMYLKCPVRLYETFSGLNKLIGNLPGLAEPIMFEISYSVIGNVVPLLAEETVLSNGNKELLMRIDSDSSSYVSQSAGKLIFSIGGGFRNVQ